MNGYEQCVEKKKVTGDEQCSDSLKPCGDGGR